MPSVVDLPRDRRLPRSSPARRRVTAYGRAMPGPFAGTPRFAWSRCSARRNWPYYTDPLIFPPILEFATMHDRLSGRLALARAFGGSTSLTTTTLSQYIGVKKKSVGALDRVSLLAS